MQYCVQLATRIEYLNSDGHTVSRTELQRIRCTSFAHAAEVASSLKFQFDAIDVCVQVWNGKGNVYVPCDTIDQIYSEMTDTKQAVA